MKKAYIINCILLCCIILISNTCPAQYIVFSDKNLKVGFATSPETIHTTKKTDTTVDVKIFLQGNMPDKDITVYLFNPLAPDDMGAVVPVTFKCKSNKGKNIMLTETARVTLLHSDISSVFQFSIRYNHSGGPVNNDHYEPWYNVFSFHHINPEGTTPLTITVTERTRVITTGFTSKSQSINLSPSKDTIICVGVYLKGVQPKADVRLNIQSHYNNNEAPDDIEPLTFYSSIYGGKDTTLVEKICVHIPVFAIPRTLRLNVSEYTRLPLTQTQVLNGVGNNYYIKPDSVYYYIHVDTAKKKKDTKQSVEAGFMYSYETVEANCKTGDSTVMLKVFVSGKHDSTIILRLDTAETNFQSKNFKYVDTLKFSGNSKSSSGYAERIVPIKITNNKPGLYSLVLKMSEDTSQEKKESSAKTTGTKKGTGTAAPKGGGKKQQVSFTSTYNYNLLTIVRKPCNPKPEDKDCSKELSHILDEFLTGPCCKLKQPCCGDCGDNCHSECDKNNIHDNDDDPKQNTDATGTTALSTKGKKKATSNTTTKNSSAKSDSTDSDSTKTDTVSAIFKTNNISIKLKNSADTTLTLTALIVGKPTSNVTVSLQDISIPPSKDYTKLDTAKKLLQPSDFKKDTARVIFPVTFLSDTAHGGDNHIMFKLTTNPSAINPGIFSQINITTKSDSNVAIQHMVINVAGYTDINNVADNDPPGFTQSYAYFNIPLRKADGIPDAGTHFHWIGLRDIYLTAVIDSKEPTLPSDTMRYNRLDALQYAYVKGFLDVNMVTGILTNGNGKDYMHFYFDAMVGILFTKDTIANKLLTGDSVKNGIITGAMFGPHFAFKTESGLSKQFIFEAGAQLLFIDPSANINNPDLSPQYRDLTEAQLSNPHKPITTSNQPYANIDAVLTYNVPAVTGGSVYLHFDYYCNFASNSGSRFINSYFQIQFGAVINIGNFFSSFGGSSSKTSSSSTASTSTSSSSTTQ